MRAPWTLLWHHLTSEWDNDSSSYLPTLNILRGLLYSLSTSTALLRWQTLLMKRRSLRCSRSVFVTKHEHETIQIKWLKQSFQSFLFVQSLPLNHAIINWNGYCSVQWVHCHDYDYRSWILDLLATESDCFIIRMHPRLPTSPQSSPRIKSDAEPPIPL